MVGRDLLENSVAQPVRPGVANVSEDDLGGGSIDERDGDRRAHPGCARVGDRALPDESVGLGDDRLEALLAVDVSAAVLQRGCSDTCGDLTRPRAAHAVGYREQWGLEDEGVLVA